MKWPKPTEPVAVAGPTLVPERVPDLVAVLNSVAGAVLALDAQGRRLYANPAAERLFDLVWRPSAPAGEPTRIPELQRLPELVHWIDAVNRERRPHAGRLELSDGRQIDVQITPLARLEGGCVIAARDVTEVVRLETARKDFIAGVSHELRTPLTSIQGYAELLRDDDDLPAETRRQFLESILSATERLSRLARDLVTLSSVETGTYPFQYATLEAATLMDPAVAALAPLARAQGCEVTIEYRGPGTIRADAEAIHRVLLNLVENAIVHGAEAALERGQQPRVTLWGGREGDGYVYRVHDNGRGIGSTDQQRVFERFYRVDRSRAAGSGTGLGLALVKHIVHEHGGQVALQSALNQGSTFTVRLPLAPAGVDEDTVLPLQVHLQGEFL